MMVDGVDVSKMGRRTLEPLMVNSWIDGQFSSIALQASKTSGLSHNHPTLSQKIFGGEIMVESLHRPRAMKV